ncbi:hypothetical protein BC828DRAFT_350911 [Blastocladiella britannica]|nr:hypothetical protein BC828DRAFT_350911 [Blastocladiella britannica]
MKTLTRKEEEAVLREVKKEALVKCEDFVKAYTECCTGRYISVVWKCRSHLTAMNDCLLPLYVLSYFFEYGMQLKMP